MTNEMLMITRRFLEALSYDGGVCINNFIKEGTIIEIKPKELEVWENALFIHRADLKRLPWRKDEFDAAETLLKKLRSQCTEREVQPKHTQVGVNEVESQLSFEILEDEKSDKNE